MNPFFSLYIVPPNTFNMSSGLTDIVIALISAGADVNKKNSDGQTPLIMASIEGNIEIVRALIEAGADVNVMEKDSKFTAVYLASCYGHTEVVKMLIKAGANIHITSTMGNTPLQIASLKGHVDVIRELLLEEMKQLTE